MRRRPLKLFLVLFLPSVVYFTVNQISDGSSDMDAHNREKRDQYRSFYGLLPSPLFVEETRRVLNIFYSVLQLAMTNRSKCWCFQQMVRSLILYFVILSSVRFKLYISSLYLLLRMVTYSDFIHSLWVILNLRGFRLQ